MSIFTFTEIKERCRTKIDSASRLKPALPEPYDRVVMQTAIKQAGAVVRKGTTIEIEAATAKLERLIAIYRPPSDHPRSVKVPSRKTIAARTRASLEACCNKKETA